MRKAFLALLILGGLLSLVPPFFTAGSCTAEFNSVTDFYQGVRTELATLAQAQEYLRAAALTYRVLSPERCDSFPTRDEVIVCPGGPVLLIALPVKDRVCRYYRDGTIRLQLGYNSRQQLVHLQTDMRPYGIVRLRPGPWELYWAR